MQKFDHKDLVQKIHQGVIKLDLYLPTKNIETLVDFIALLIKWNKAYNLTAIHDPNEIVTRHILDSLSIAPYIKGREVLDVGTGAGFPGIPLALAFPEFQFTLLDSNGKKTRFLLQAIAQLGIKNTRVVQERLEKYTSEYAFNAVVMRAVALTPALIAAIRRVLDPTGRLLIMKGTYPATQLEKIASHVKVYELHVPELNEQRHLICLEGIS